MGKANRENRRAKAKQEHEKQRRRAAREGRGPVHSGGGHDPRATYVELLTEHIVAAVQARILGERQAYGRHLGRLTDAAADLEFRDLLDELLFHQAEVLVKRLWAFGWQPGELVRQVRRAEGVRQSRIAADAIAAELRGYSKATIPESWDPQLAAIDARVWWRGGAGHGSEWRDRENATAEQYVESVLETVAALGALPAVPLLDQVPGEARRGSLSAHRAGGNRADPRMLDKVRALLAKAEATDFPKEAEALSARAQELMARNSIDYALLAANNGRRDATITRRIPVDGPYESPKAVLLEEVATANRCRSILHGRWGLASVIGFASDIDAVEMLFTSLLVQATSAMTAEGGRRRADGTSRTRSFRQTFLIAFAQRIGERLAESTAAAEEQAAAELSGADLLPVLAARDRAVDDAFAESFPEATFASAGRTVDGEGWSSGTAAADRAELHARRRVGEAHG
ncbi:uncharacterized protein DUF2786 [Murinocardiopsis flavida]|uniref:Uncharacterized protein DUF2786 n=1 Tax=Murinocardiopsis flavida TaxID=645275 RepID=A0A2P8DET8_9ACTN|nr:DUF2786 domain-containing protein [Murinocardiopsis flavida]PSK95709.1 uncharacterized protein DUF2786 [Murinocardiopsis flavida]